MAAGAAMSWFIRAHFGYLAYIALTVRNIDRAIMWVIFAVTGPAAMHFGPGQHRAAGDSGSPEEEGGGTKTSLTQPGTSVGLSPRGRRVSARLRRR